MKFFYDTEFIDDGMTIDLVSIGIVAEDGREFYAVSSEFNMATLCANPWLKDNVLPSLPTTSNKGLRTPYPVLDKDSPDVRSRAQISRAVHHFLTVEGNPELWAWYAAYDHVALAQLWGAMINLPDDMPKWTNDLKQEAFRQGDPELPEQPDGEHNALADARHNLVRAKALGIL